MRNDTCYLLEPISSQSGIFDSIIDACYIIYLSGNEARYERILSQTRELPLCKNTLLCHNFGYKKCHKRLKDQRSTYDLIDAYMYIFNDALEKKYDQIAVLEDDFIYENALFTSHHQKSVCDFLEKKKCASRDFVYSLGALPYLQSLHLIHPRHTHVYLSSGTHAMIYPKCAIKKIYHQRDHIHDMDLYLNQYYFYKKYGYTLPLITQTFPETENAKSWGSHLKIDGYKYMKYMFHFFQLHESTFHYKTFFILSILLFYTIAYFLFKKIAKLF